MSKMRKRNGFSIVEVVIALSVIVIVSITALSIALSSVSTRVAAINRTQAQSFADNVLESFKAAEDEAEFISLVAFAEGVTLTDGALDEDGNTVYTYYSEENKFMAQISVKFVENQTERSEFEINVTDKDGDEIVSFPYRKGDGI